MCYQIISRRMLSGGAEVTAKQAMLCNLAPSHTTSLLLPAVFSKTRKRKSFRDSASQTSSVPVTKHHCVFHFALFPVSTGFACIIPGVSRLHSAPNSDEFEYHVLWRFHDFDVSGIKMLWFSSSPTSISFLFRPLSVCHKNYSFQNINTTISSGILLDQVEHEVAQE